MPSEQIPLFPIKFRSFQIDVSPDSSITRTVVVTLPDNQKITRESLLGKACHEMAGRYDATDVMDWQNAIIEELED